MKTSPSSQVHLHHLRVVRNELLCWLNLWGDHEETVEGRLHAHEVGKREDSLSCRADSSVEGKGPCSPCRSRCGGGEQSDDEDEAVHYESDKEIWEASKCWPNGGW